jgi:choline monooxygenase
MQSVEDILGKEAIGRVRAPVEQATGLPGIAYTGQAFYDLERDRLFPRAWMGVGFAHQIPAPGDAVPIECAGVPLILLRDGDGAIRVYHNVCRHRAALVLDAPCKALKTLQCPYHAWTYDLDGALVATPFWDGHKRPKDRNFDPADNALVPIATGVWLDLVFVNLGGQAAPFEDFIRPLASKLALYDLSALASGGARIWTFEANWKLAVDNWEMFHEPWVNAGVLPLRVDARSGEKWFADIAEGCYYGYVTPTTSWQDELKYGLPLIPGMDVDETSASYIIAIWPNVAFVLKANYMAAWIYLPQGPARSEFKATFLFHDDGAVHPQYAKARQDVAERWTRVVGEDIGIFESQHRARASLVADAVKFSPYWEAYIHMIQNRVLDAVS